MKEGLRKLKDGIVTDRLSRILFLGHRLKSRLDILRPSLDEQVRAKLSQQNLNMTRCQDHNVIKCLYVIMIKETNGCQELFLLSSTTISIILPCNGPE